jgi:hypothetical protein
MENAMGTVPKLILVTAGLSLIAGCISKECSELSLLVGDWKYDKISLREHALKSAIDSVSGGEPESLSAEELSDVQGWVLEQHKGWNKTISINADMTYEWVSKTGDSAAETSKGTWRWSNDQIVFLNDAGVQIATAHFVEGALVLMPGETDEVGVGMVMNPSSN